MTHAAELRTAAGRTPDTALAALLAVLADAAEHPAAATTGLLATVLHPALAVARGIRDTTQETHMPDTTPTLRDRIAAALLTRIKMATVSKTQPFDAVTSLLAANEFDLADAVLPVLPARLVLGTTDQQPTECPQCGDAGACNGGPCPLTPPADTELRDRVRHAICETSGQGHLWGTDMLEPDEFGWQADAVLAVLPAPVDRAAVLREAASAVESSDVAYNTEAATAALINGGPFALIAFVQLAIGAHLRRLADEAQQPETEAHRPLTEWIGEVLEDDGLWMYLGSDPDRSVTERRRASVTRRFPGAQTRAVRKTTTYTVAADQPDTETEAAQ